MSYKERAPSAVQKEANNKKETSKSGKDSKGKGGKAGKDKDKGSRPASQQFDITKPNWLLRVVSDGSAAVSGHTVICHCRRYKQILFKRKVLGAA